MKKPKRNILIGGIIAALGLAFLAYVGYILFTVLDAKPCEAAKAHFASQLSAEEELTNVTAARMLTLDFGTPFEHASPQIYTVLI